MKLTFFYQSGFLIEGNDFIIIIDYYKSNDLLHENLLHKIEETSKTVYVLVTHSHYDHFNPEILRWNGINTNIKYVFNKEMASNAIIKTCENKIVFLDKCECYNDLNIDLKAFGSTDLGGSFYLKCEDKSIFHAGDLNNWHWNEEVSHAEAAEAESFYLQELKLVSDDIKSLDMLMYPVDPRLGKDFMKGILQFIEKIDVKTVIPMHFGDNSLNHEFVREQLLQTNKHINYIPIDKKGYSINF